MRQMVFANIFVEGWTVYPNVYSLFDQPDKIVTSATLSHIGNNISQRKPSGNNINHRKSVASYPQCMVITSAIQLNHGNNISHWKIQT